MVITAPAGGSTAITVNTAVYESAPELDMAVMERFQRLYRRGDLHPSDSKPEMTIYSPSASMPSWFEKVQCAIHTSISEGLSAEQASEGGSLRPDVAEAAVDFFERTADLFGDEPYLYPSHDGELIAEIATERGRLTSIVSASWVLLFGARDGVTFERRVANSHLLRTEVQRLIKQLETVPHGNLETEAR